MIYPPWLGLSLIGDKGGTVEEKLISNRSEKAFEVVEDGCAGNVPDLEGRLGGIYMKIMKLNGIIWQGFITHTSHLRSL